MGTNQRSKRKIKKMKSSSIISLFALTIASMSADATNNIRGRNLEEDAKVEGIRCCKKNDTENCNIYSDSHGDIVCDPIGDSGGSCFSFFGSQGRCCTSADVGTYWFPVGCK